MRIVLKEILADREQARHEFDQRSVILIGRDPQQCDIVFNQDTWPMVSRVHASLRVEGNSYLLADNNSTQGTFLNQQPVLAPAALQTGARIQFGQDGPILEVELTSVRPSALLDTPASMPSNKASPAQALPVQGQRQTERIVFKYPVLVFEGGAGPERAANFVLKSDVTVIGRDPAVDLLVDAAAQGVSRRHAELRRTSDGSFQIVDLKSFNGTLVNGQRIAQPTALSDGDRIQLSVAGPVFRFVDPAKASPKSDQPAEIKAAVAESASSVPALPGPADEQVDMGGGLSTLVYRAGVGPRRQTSTPDRPSETLLVQCPFDGKERLGVGRSRDNDIHLDGLLISKYHARFIRTARELLIEDAGSTNGVFLNGARVTGRRPVQSQDIIQIGPFVLKADPIIGVSVFDTRSETRIDAINITDQVPSLSGVGTLKLLDGVSLAIEPNEFVGLLGPSGAGKSTLMSVLNGMKRTSAGRVFMNTLDLYQHLYSLKQSIGYVPQDDIIHRELTCYNTLYYVARLRLSRDVPRKDIDQIINEVLEVTGLAERRHASIFQLSGGQRKRVSIALELITKPSVIFLDEPTSGLDPATEERIMKLFRQIAESGRTVIMTTHAMENVHLFDKIVLLMRGRLIFYGTPNEALTFFGARNFIELYNKLEEPLPAQTADLSPEPAEATKLEKPGHEARRNATLEADAEHWRARFAATETYERYITRPLSRVNPEGQARPAARHGLGAIDSVRQWATLVARYARILASDRFNLLILFGQAPIIGLMTYLAIGRHESRDFAYFVLALIPLWFGTSVAAREIVKERSVFKRERMVNLALLPYLCSKLFALSWIVGLQCALLFGTLKLLHFANLMYLPGLAGGLGHWLTMVLTGMVGIALGLFVSALVRTSEMATSIVPLLLIPQILLCGLVGIPAGVARVVGAAMPATWSFDEMKRLSTLDTLRAEGADPQGATKGLGLFESVKDTNTRRMQQARTQLDDYSRRAGESMAEYDRRIRSLIARGNSEAVLSAQPPNAVGSVPRIPEAEGIKDDLSSYVTFKHSWGGIVVNPSVLLFMLFALVVATLIVLRTQDAKAQKN